MSIERKRIRKQLAGTKGDLQEQITQLVGLTFEVTSALGKANDALGARVEKLENALKAAQAKAGASQGIITLGKN